MSQPFVSVLTPTQNRREFMDSMIANYTSQSYPHDRMEWIVIDDGTEPLGAEFEAKVQQQNIPNVTQIQLEDKLTLGEKRNRLNALAKGEQIVCMDDDDQYPPERVAHVVAQFRKNPTIHLAGSSTMHLQYPKHSEIWQLGPFHKNHSTNGPLAYTKQQSNTHKQDEYVTQAEEASFLDQLKNPMIQLDPKKTILVICHTNNTFGKETFRNNPHNPSVKKTTLKLADLIQDAARRDFFQSLGT